LRDNHRMHI